jgi:hypothetical protein
MIARFAWVLGTAATAGIVAIAANTTATAIFNILLPDSEVS